MTEALQIQNQVPAELVKERASQCLRRIPVDMTPFVTELKSRFGDSLDVILLYGSCLHSDSLADSVVDLYAVVRDYRSAYDRAGLRILNSIVPPNVFYLEVPGNGLTLRAKYGVISIDDFIKRTGPWFNSYIWGRFAQPTRMLYVRNEEITKRINNALAMATLTFLKASIPALGKSIVDTETIWTRGLSLSYATELRPEHNLRAQQLTYLSMGDYNRLTENSVSVIPDLLEKLPRGKYRSLVDDNECSRSLRQWRMRYWQGRALTIIRFAKAVVTFRDCIDYAAWKVERHTGIKIEVTNQLRRHPLLLGWRVLWQLVRRGVLH